LRLGTTAFGGPTAHIAMMEEEFVRRRQWLTRDEFLDLVGLAGLVPGPSSTEVAILVGYRRAGCRGLLLAGTCFIVPAAVIVTALAWVYVHFGRLPAPGGVLMGIKPVIVAVVAQSLVALGRTAIKKKGLLAIALLAAGADLFDAPPTAILAAAGVLSSLGRVAQRPDALKTLLGPAALAAPATLASPRGSRRRRRLARPHGRGGRAPRARGRRRRHDGPRGRGERPGALSMAREFGVARARGRCDRRGRPCGPLRRIADVRRALGISITLNGASVSCPCCNASFGFGGSNSVTVTVGAATVGLFQPSYFPWTSYFDNIQATIRR
jgi:chromate transport protein ChrA